MDERGRPVVGPLRPVEPAKSVEDEVEDGVLLLENAARMALKNRVVVDTLTAADGAPSAALQRDWAWFLEERLEILARESIESAHRLADERDYAATVGGRGRYYHDYRHLDADNLDRRVRIAAELARRLRAMRTDPDAVAQLLQDARDAADAEMLHATRVALASAPDRASEDAAQIATRVAELQQVDIPALAEEAVRRAAEQAAFEEQQRTLRRRVRRLFRRSASEAEG